MENYNKIWRIVFAVSLAAIAVQQMVCGGFRTVIMPLWPVCITGCMACVWVFSILLFLANAAIIVNWMARPVAFYMGIVLFVMFMVFHVPYQVQTSLHSLGPWTNSLKLLAYSGGAFLAAASLNGKQGGNLCQDIKWLIPVGRIFFAIVMVVFGIEHFVYPEFVAMLVPAWIPGHLFWTYFAGVALIAGGLGVILNIQLRLAAMLLGIMIFLWFIILHIPRAIAAPATDGGNELTSVFEAFGFSGIAFLIAGTAKKRI